MGTEALRGARSKRLAGLARRARKAGFELGVTQRNFIVLRCGTCRAWTTFSRSVTDGDRRVCPAVRLWLLHHGLGVRAAVAVRREVTVSGDQRQHDRERGCDQVRELCNAPKE